MRFVVDSLTRLVRVKHGGVPCFLVDIFVLKHQRPCQVPPEMHQAARRQLEVQRYGNTLRVENVDDFGNRYAGEIVQKSGQHDGPVAS